MVAKEDVPEVVMPGSGRRCTHSFEGVLMKAKMQMRNAPTTRVSYVEDYYSICTYIFDPHMPFDNGV
jgi:hypothetical protein